MAARYSDLPLRYKITAIVAFVAIMAVVWWFANKLAYEWLPDRAVGYVALAIICLSAGYLLGERAGRKQERDSGAAPGSEE